MKSAIKNRKGMELSINMIIVVALAVLTLFLVITFVLGGFSYFQSLLSGVSSTPDQVAQTKCEISLNHYRSLGGRTGKLCDAQHDIDWNADGKVDDLDKTYTCGEYFDTSDICGGGLPV